MSILRGEEQDYSISGGLCFDHDEGELTIMLALGLVTCLGELKDFYEII